MSVKRKVFPVGIWLLVGIAHPTIAAPGQDFDFESLRRIIAEHRVHSVEELVAVLPADLRTNFSLVFDSRSLQSASLQNPRVVLFGRSARFIMTFNGDSAQRGFNTVETMQVDTVSGRFFFREITFTNGAADPAVSDPNPARCAACHDDPARPIWDVPPAWPGVYGERYGAGLSRFEMTGLQGFLARLPSHPRYRYLVGTSALLDRDTYVSSARAAYDSKVAEPPNARLSRLLATLNVQSILSQLAAQPGFAAHLFVLLASAGSNCGPLEDFFPPSMHSAVSADIKRFADVTRAADRRQMEAKDQRRMVRSHANDGLAPPAEYTELRYIAERDLNVSTRQWTLAFERGSYDLSAPAGSLSLEPALFEWLALSDVQLRSVAAYRTFNADDAYCKHLRQASVAALRAWYAEHAVARSIDDAGPAPPILQQCAACHRGEIAPALPFEDSAALRAGLLEGHYAHGRLLEEILFRLSPQAGPGRMPRGTNIDAAEQLELEHYFVTLALPKLK